MDGERKFRDYLESRGMRLTRLRETVMAEALSRDMFYADLLANRLSSRTDGRRVSRATIYRAISDMVDAGLLRNMGEGVHGPFQRADPK